MSDISKINEFQAAGILDMDDDTRRAWDQLSDFERKLIVAQAFFFKRGYMQAQRGLVIENLQWANLRDRGEVLDKRLTGER